MPNEVLEFLKSLVTFVGGGFATLVLGPPTDRDRVRFIELLRSVSHAPQGATGAGVINELSRGVALELQLAAHTLGLGITTGQRLS